MFSIKHMSIIFSVQRRSNPIFFLLTASLIVFSFSVSANAQSNRKNTSPAPSAGKNYSMGSSGASQSTTANSMQLSGSNAPLPCSQQAHDFSFTIEKLAPDNSHCKAALVDISKDSAKFKSTTTKTQCVISYYLNQCKGKATDLDPVAANTNEKSGSSSGVGAAGMAAAAAALAPVAIPLVNEYFDKKGSGAASDGVAGKNNDTQPLTTVSTAEQTPASTNSVNSTSNTTNPNSDTSATSVNGSSTGFITSTPESSAFKTNSPFVTEASTDNSLSRSGSAGVAGELDMNLSTGGASATSGGNSLLSGGGGLPSTLTPEQLKEIDSIPGDFNQQASALLKEALNELAPAAAAVGMNQDFKSIVQQYEEVSKSCGTAAARAETFCVEEKSPLIKKSMTALSAGLPIVQAAMGASDTCSKANQLMDVLSKGITLAQGTCAALKATCDLTCARVGKNIQEVSNKLKAFAASVQQAALANQLNQAAVQAGNASITIDKFASADFTPKQPEAVAARVAKCGAYTETIVKTGLGLMSMAMSNKALKDCKEKTKAAASTDKCSQIEFSGTQECLCKRADMQGTAACGTANLDIKCAMEQYAGTTECYCHKNPGVASCSGQSIAGLNMNGGQQKMTNGANGDSTNGSLTGGGPTFGLGSQESKFAGKPSSTAGGAPSAGGGGAAGPSGLGGGGSSGMPSSDVSEKAKEGGLTAALQSFAGGFGFGNRDKKSVEAAKQALKNQRQQNPSRSIASENGVTGPVGKSLWEKVRHTYGAKSSTLIEQ